MNLNALLPLLALVRSRRVDSELPAEERAVYENFGADERVSVQREAGYATVLGAVAWVAMDDLVAAHGRHLRQRIWSSKTGADIPDTFDAGSNGANFWPDIDDGVALYRIESASFALRNVGVDEPEFQRAIEAFGARVAGSPEHVAAQAVLQRVLAEWNRSRDRRPAFATTADEIRDLLAASGADWPNAVRDHLGLGHLSPAPGSAMAVVLMRYTAAEVRASAKAAGMAGFCIPTVLDGHLSPYYFPTPIPGPGASGSAKWVGRAVNLTPATRESDYRMGMELLHSFVEYKPQHLARWGIITRPRAANLAELRSFHLSWLRLETERDTFGCDIGIV